MPTWSLCKRSLASTGITAEPIYINLENVLTVERLATFAVWVGIWETLGVQQSSLLGRTSTTHA